MCRFQAEEEAKQHTRLSEQLGEMHKKQEVEVCGMISVMKLCVLTLYTLILKNSWPLRPRIDVSRHLLCFFIPGQTTEHVA